MSQNINCLVIAPTYWGTCVDQSSKGFVRYLYGLGRCWTFMPGRKMPKTNKWNENNRIPAAIIAWTPNNNHFKNLFITTFWPENLGTPVLSESCSVLAEDADKGVRKLNRLKIKNYSTAALFLLRHLTSLLLWVVTQTKD